jgi:amidase
MLRYLVPLLLAAAAATTAPATFVLEEATIESIHRAFAGGALTSRGLVELYLRRIASLDPALHAVVELDADGTLAAAERADAARLLGGAALPPLHGIPVLIKDNIAAAGALNATAGSLALVGSRPARDAGVVERLRRAGAVVLGTASLSEWCNFRAPGVPAGWSPRGGQGLVSRSASSAYYYVSFTFASKLELQVHLSDQGQI